MTRPEFERLHAGVFGVIRGLSARGAGERVHALKTMRPPSDYFALALLPLSTAPTLVLFAEDESAVLDPRSPTRFTFDHAVRAYFPNGRVERVVRTFGATAVQHASLIFHAFSFLPPLAAFYRRSKSGKLKRAA
jgi:hypothetical protein